MVSPRSTVIGRTQEAMVSSGPRQAPARGGYRDALQAPELSDRSKPACWRADRRHGVRRRDDHQGPGPCERARNTRGLGARPPASGSSREAARVRQSPREGCPARPRAIARPRSLSRHHLLRGGQLHRSHGRDGARAGPAPRADDEGARRKTRHFVKTSKSSVVVPGARVKLPVYSQMVDWEVELAAVIGEVARDVPVEKALDYVAGYTIADDLSARDVMKRDKNPATSPFHYDWLSQKCFDGSCPLGPWIVPAGDIADPQNLALKLWVNDTLMQNSSTSKMIFDTAEQIAMLSSRVTLQPGDLVLTGTPAGVGMPRRLFLKPGDRVKLWIEGIGEFSHTMAS